MNVLKKFLKLFKKEKQVPGVKVRIPGGTVILGNAQHQGMREYQEDSFGFSEITEDGSCSKGILAVLADGMGGLTNGKQVSETIVSELLSWFNIGKTTSCTGEELKEKVISVNRKICDAYCTDGTVTSGSTLVAAAINNGFLHWFCVGDSRLYIKRGGRIYTVNEDHDYLSELLCRVMDGTLSASAAFSEPQKDSLVSCIGKSELTDFDYSEKGFELCDGDCIALCSDGVYNALSEEEMCECITEDAMLACGNIKNRILSKRVPNQDNNTIIIISYRKEER